MKKLCLILTVAALMPCLQAQDKPTISASQQQTQTAESNKTGKQPAITAVKPNEGVRGTGIAYEISDKGLIVISPTAPANMGYPKQALSVKNPAPSTPASNAVSDQDRSINGLALVGWEW